jgi:hypothetical protein
MSTPIYSCPHCNANHPTFAHYEEAHLVACCQPCGFPVMEEPKLNVTAFRAGATRALQEPLESGRLNGSVKTALAVKPMAPIAGVR